jgi:DNA modification methylase
MPPALSSSSEVAGFRALDKLVVGDARSMDEVPASSVALVVTSPPYFAGKEYEEALGQGGAPGTYFEYLELLREVFAECTKKLEPGGRIAVNVANLGRRPYRSLSADVIGILQDDLRLLLRGEVIWLKQRGSAGSCAWGSFQQPGNPVLRDLTERVVIASKGRFDRAVSPKSRASRGLPHEASMTREDFMEATLDVWEIPAESATRVGHPAPFPVDLPARLIDLYTYRGDLVLDPFVGSGTTAVAAVRSGRHFVGYDLEPSYIALAEARVAEERGRLAASRASVAARPAASSGSATDPGETTDPGEDTVYSAVHDGWSAKDVASLFIQAAGFSDIQAGKQLARGVEVDFVARDDHGQLWFFDVCGPFTTYRPGLMRADALWKALGKAAVWRELTRAPLVLLTAGLPGGRSVAASLLDTVTGPGKPVLAVVGILEPPALLRLRKLRLAGAPPSV